MPLKSILDTIDDLSEESKALYTETKVGDKTVFVLDVDGIDDHPKVRGVITANRENVRKRDAYKAEADALKSRLEGLPEDFDADAYEALKAHGFHRGSRPHIGNADRRDGHVRAGCLTMRVEILKGFSVDGKDGETHYEPGQIVTQGQRNWCDKGLAIETTKDAPKAGPEPENESAEKPKGGVDPVSPDRWRLGLGTEPNELAWRAELQT